MHSEAWVALTNESDDAIRYPELDATIEPTGQLEHDMDNLQIES